MPNSDKAEKSVLMLCPKFFGYEKRIADALGREGYRVDLYDERPGNGFVAKTCVRYQIGFYRPVIRRYFETIIRENQNKKYDYVFVVKGEGVTVDVIKSLRRAWPDAKFLLYLWDSVENIPDCENRMKLYDRVLTFDAQDAKQYQIPLRPLFFGKEYESDFVEPAEYAYDFAFIGTAHTIRPQVVKALGAQCRAQGRDYYSYLYLPHSMVYWYNKVFNPAYRGVKKSEIRFVPLSADAIKSVYRKSRCILDVEHSKQIGLTMRTIELVGMRKKIITTNPQVKDYDFYHPNNIYVIDREHPAVPKEFWEKTYEPISESILKRYSLSYFLHDIFGGEESEA